MTGSPRLPGPSCPFHTSHGSPRPTADAVAARKSINAMANVIASAPAAPPQCKLRSLACRRSPFYLRDEARIKSRAHTRMRGMASAGCISVRSNHDCNLLCFSASIRHSSSDDPPDDQKAQSRAQSTCHHRRTWWWRILGGLCAEPGQGSPPNDCS